MLATELAHDSVANVLAKPVQSLTPKILTLQRYPLGSKQPPDASQRFFKPSPARKRQRLRAIGPGICAGNRHDLTTPSRFTPTLMQAWQLSAAKMRHIQPTCLTSAPPSAPPSSPPSPPPLEGSLSCSCSDSLLETAERSYHH